MLSKMLKIQDMPIISIKVEMPLIWINIHMDEDMMDIIWET